MSNEKKEAYILVDIAHNTTKAILIEDQYIKEITEASTTVDEPTLDVTKGVADAINQLEKKTGKKILLGNKVAADFKLLCSSNTSGGLHMIVTGVIGNISGESAQRAALGAGALLIDQFSKDDDRPDYKKIAIMRRLKPDF